MGSRRVRDSKLATLGSGEQAPACKLKIFIVCQVCPDSEDVRSAAIC